MEEIKKKKRKRRKVISILTIITTILAHVSVAAVVLLSYRYYQLEMRTFLSIIAAVVCLLIIIDIMFFVGHNYRDIRIKIATLVISLLVLITGSIGTYLVSRINKSVDSIIDNAGTDQFEVVGGVISYYQKDASSKTYSSLEDLKAANNLTVGVLYDDGVGTGTMAKEIFEKEGIDANFVQYSTNDDLLSALVGEEESVKMDLAVFPGSYRQRMLSDENVDYSQYLDRIVDFYSFEEKIKTSENLNANKDLSSEPFNILLIGFAPEDEAMTYGLADSIIVATVNPQTLTVVMTSIARDSFVPISCYGGTRDKINAARGTSRACLMETVGNLLDMKIDYYMEVNFMGVVQIVDALGGILINNPVTFVGQTASGIRGEFTVYVPAGENVPADGEMALAFARERHAMPGGDFDRQQHQQEVIAEIVRGLLEMKDVNKALKVMEAAGKNISTNLSLTQLTGVFNYLMNTKSATGLPVFNMIDIQNMRVTGYSSWTYNQSMKLPLWIYKLYDGSINEAKRRINEVMNNYTLKKVSQSAYMTFQVQYPYNRGQLYSLYFDEPQVHEELPAYYPYLTKYTYEEAVNWASSKGVTLNITFINEDNPNYVESQRGQVIEQFPRQGSLVSEYPVGSITVMGSMDPNYAPTYTVENCNDLDSCVAFANSKGIKYEVQNKVFSDKSHKDGEFAGTNYANGEKIKKNATLVIYVWKYQASIVVPNFEGNTVDQYTSILSGLKLKHKIKKVETGATPENHGTIVSVTPEINANVKEGDTITIYVYNYVEPEKPEEEKTDPPTEEEKEEQGEEQETEEPKQEDSPVDVEE